MRLKSILTLAGLILGLALFCSLVGLETQAPVSQAGEPIAGPAQPAQVTTGTLLLVTKSVTPQGLVSYGAPLTYTLSISIPPDTPVGLYDPLAGLGFSRFVTQPPGIEPVSGAISGTLTATSTGPILVSFVARATAPGTAGWTGEVSNQACLYPAPGSLGGCVWSNLVSNPVFYPYRAFLPVAMRRHPTNHPPSPPSAPSPADGATEQPTDISLSWTGSDPNGDSLSYDVYLEAGAGPPSQLVCTEVTDPACAPGPLSSDIGYAWQVIARDPYSATTIGPVWTFSTTSGCPTTSPHAYVGGTVYQYELDDPVRPAYEHADKNLALRGYILNDDPNLKRELVDYGSGDPTQPPQFATLFDPPRVPPLSQFYQMHDWAWASSPDPGERADPITQPPVTALGLAVTQGETLYVPASGYDIGGGMEVVIIFADEDTVALRYTREDTSGSPGYTVHVDNFCTDPNLLTLYNSLDDPDGPRYVYVPPDNRPYSYPLPTLPADYPIGTAKGTEVVVAIVDTGGFQDPRSCNEWWQIRPGYQDTCPPP